MSLDISAPAIPLEGDALSCPKAQLLAYEGAEINNRREKELCRVDFDKSTHLVEDAVVDFRAAIIGSKIGGEGMEDVSHLPFKGAVSAVSWVTLVKGG
jgi:hypothetical protein